MANTVRYFRDSLTVDQNLIYGLSPQPGDTLVFGARQVILSALVSTYDYVIVADKLTVAPNAPTSLTGQDGNPSPDVTVLAGNIEGVLQLKCAGMNGEDGAAGEDGESGVTDNPEGGRPIILPGGAGGNGENGTDGGAGGKITVFYGSATQAPTGTAPGGIGGRGGQGGRGGAGKPPGKAGRPGKAGNNGGPGLITIAQVAEVDLFKSLDAASAQGWAAYRAEVAGFYFRKFDFGSQLTALDETRAALLLNPADAEALTIQSRIMNRQIPSGLPRDLDIAPDFPELAANLTAEIAVVQNAFQSFVSVVSLETIAESIRESLDVMRVQLGNRKQEAQADVVIAKQDVEIAKAEKTNIQKQIDDVQKAIDEVRNRGFSFGDLISDVGSIAAVVAGMATGVGAIISIPAGLAALQRVAEGRDLVTLLGELSNAAKDPKHKTKFEQDIANINGLGGDLKDLVKGTKSMISFVKVVSDLEGAMSHSDQSETGKLLKQQALLVRQKMVAALREKQANTRVAAAELRVNNIAAEIADINERLSHWNNQIASLTAATDVLVRSARRLVDMVMEDVFLAQRAREIYQLELTPDLRFDFGFLHPDHDRSLGPAQRAAATLTSLSGMPIQVLSWIKMFQQLNTAQIGFDVIHPQLSLTIGDPAQLQAFANGAVLSFSIGLADLPSGMFELKGNALGLEMTGASSTQSSNIWVTHSGEWSMNRRTDGSVTTMTLRPRREVFAIPAGTGKLTANIPATPQSNSEPGPPFSFWGRGVATTFRLQIAPPSTMNLSQLSAIHITVSCIAFAPQSAGAKVKITPEIQVLTAQQLMELAIA